MRREWRESGESVGRYLRESRKRFGGEWGESGERVVREGRENRERVVRE